MSADNDTPEAFMQRVAAIVGKPVDELKADCERIGNRNAMDSTQRKGGIEIAQQNKTVRRVYHAPWKR
ncbi:hypothetical protein EVB87_052 [Rhizobium phage RHph_N28_1]|nr:hypothetical protein EVB87_052 [Rhizobium phage RHph_N28_1]QIG74080.1 hypothetical protein EVC07_052 [Rhizobium phage RHph_N42]QXV73740.1 hypothetical protein [Rhizobium phage RHph_N46]